MADYNINQNEITTTSIYTDEQHVLIAKQEYKKYEIGDQIVINGSDTIDPEDGDITVGYVAEVIHHDIGADVYVVTDIELPENPTEADCAKVKRVTMLYQGSTQLVEDWLTTNPSLGWHVTTGGVFLPELHLDSSVDLSTVGFYNVFPNSNILITKQNMARYSSENTKNFPSTVKSSIPQLAISSIILNNTMEKFPNAMFDLYAHSLGSSDCQYSLGMCQYPERINSARLYNGPNAYSLLSFDGKKIPDFLFSRIHIIYDPHDPVGWAYWQKGSVGIVTAVKTESLGISIPEKKKQHGWGAYIFDYFGNNIDIDGNIVTKITGFSELDINRDGLPDIYFNNINNQNIFSDYSDLSNLKNLNFSLDFNYSPLQFSKIGIDIQLNPELLHTLISNIISDIEISLSVMLGICTLCIESNSEIGEKKEDREKTVYESIQEVFRECKIPLILENLHASIKGFTCHCSIFDILSSPGTLLTTKFTSDEKLHSIGHQKYGLTVNDFNNQLTKLANESIKIAELCNAQKCDDISSLSENQTVVIKSWKTVEDAQKSLLESSNQLFEGNGLRAGKNDAIQQSIKEVLEVEEANIKELQNAVSNLNTFMTVTTLSFDDKDSSLGAAIETGTDFNTGSSVSGVPQNYEAYLNRSEIFDDVKDVIQAFDIQVEKNCKEYAKKVTEIYGESLGQFENGLSTWLEIANEFKNIVNSIYNSFNFPVVVTKRYSFTYTLKGDSYTTYSYKQEFWGELKKLYKSTVVDSVEQAVDKILPLIPIISATLNSSKTAKNSLSNIEPELKQIIEDGVYKSIDLMEVVQSQKIVLQLAVKCKLQIRFVIDSINNASMKGQAITTLLTKLSQIETLLGYFSTFVSDCFGDNYSEEASAATPQSSARNFSLNTFT